MDTYTNQSNDYERFNQTGGPTPEQLKTAAYKQIQAAYKQYLDREASESEIESHLAGRYDAATIKRAVDTIRTSAEAQSTGARLAEQRTQQQQQQPQQSQAPGTTPPGSQTPSTAQFTREQRDQLTWGNTGRMEGFEVNSTYGGDVKARNSVKNTFGRIASRYPATPEGLRQVVNDPDFKRAFPNARLIEDRTGDKIDFGGVKSDFETGTPVGLVDVGRAFAGAEQKEQTAWVWQPQSTASAEYARTQYAIRNPASETTTPGLVATPGVTTGQEGPGYRVADAVTPPTGQNGELNAFDDYLTYLRNLMAQYGTQPPSR